MLYVFFGSKNIQKFSGKHLRLGALCSEVEGPQPETYLKKTPSLNILLQNREKY